MDLSSFLLIAPQLLLSIIALSILRFKACNRVFTRWKDPLVATGILAFVLVAMLVWVMYIDSGNPHSLVMLAVWFVGSCVFAMAWPIVQMKRRRKLNSG